MFENNSSKIVQIVCISILLISFFSLLYISNFKNKIFVSGTFTKSDGTTGTFGEFLFDTDVTESTASEILEETDGIAELPDISGSGNIYSLHQAMLRDESGELVA